MARAADIEERIFKCEKILSEDPSSQIFAALADAYRKKGDVEKAFRVCQNGLKIHDNYGSAHIIMAKINLDRGLYDWAEAETEKAAVLDGRTRTVELLMSEIHIYKGEFNQAIKLLKKLHETDPGNGQITRLLDIAQKIPEEQAAKERAEMLTVVPGSRQGSSPAPVGQPVAVVSETEIEPINTKQLLQKVVLIPGVDGALFVNTEGLVVESEWCLQIDPNLCGAAIGEVGNFLDQELLQSSFGSASAVLIESEALTYHLVKRPNGVFLFVGNSSATLGSLRMRVEKLMLNFRE